MPLQIEYYKCFINGLRQGIKRILSAGSLLIWKNECPPLFITVSADSFLRCCYGKNMGSRYNQRPL